MTYVITITGMSCAHCVRRVARALGAVPGVSVTQVEVGRAVVEGDAGRATAAALVRAVDEAGYQAEVAS
jgi:copper chaperone